MEVFNEVERFYEDLATVSPEDEQQVQHVIDFVCNEHRQLRSEINLKLLELVNEGSLSRSKGSRSYRPSHSAKSTKFIKLERATKRAELAIRLKHYQKENEADRMKLEKDFEITQVKLRVIEEEQQSQGSPLQLPEEDPHERVQSFLDAMPTAGAPKQQPDTPSTPVQTALATDA